MGTVNANFLPATTGLNLGSDAQKWDGFFQQVQAEQINNRINADSFSGADMGAKIEAAISAAASTGATIDARGFQGAQTISSSILVNKPVRILLGHAAITTSVTRAFDITRAGRHSSIIGIGKGSSTDGGTRIIAADNAVTQLIRVQGTNTSTTTSKIRIQDLTIEGSDTADGQIGILYNFFTDVFLSGVQFAELGQAEDIDDGARLGHFDTNYFHCGTGGTAATATVRIEQRSAVGQPLNQVWWNYCLWEGDNTGGNNKQGTSIYSTGADVTTLWLMDSFMDYDSTNPDFPLVFLSSPDSVQFGRNLIFATTISVANAVVDVTGTSGDRATNVQLYGNRIAFSNAVPGLRWDWGNNNHLTGGIFRGPGSGTAISITSNHLSGTIGPFQMASLDTAVSNSSATVATFFQQQPDLTAWHMPEGLAVGTAPATSGVIRLGNNEIIRGRDVGDAANKTMMFLGIDDAVHLGEATVPTEIEGDLDHDGINVGFYGAAPVAQAAASAALTGTPGTADGAMATISGSGDDTNINNNFQEVQDKVNAALAALRGVGLIAT